MLSVFYAECRYDEHRNAECRYAECRGAHLFGPYVSYEEKKVL
jgi:hypothetical protein